MLIRVGFSADPDDAFMFWGLASGTVDARGYEFEPVIDQAQGVVESARPQVERGISKAQQQAQRITRRGEDGGASVPGPGV